MNPDGPLSAFLHLMAPWAAGTISALAIMILRRIQHDTSKMAERMDALAEHWDAQLAGVGRRHDDHFQDLSSRVARIEGHCEVRHHRRSGDKEEGKYENL